MNTKYQELYQIQKESRATLKEAEMLYAERAHHTRNDWVELLEVLREGLIEDAVWQEERAMLGDFDPTPEQIAGEQFQDKVDMYRNEY